MRVLNRKIVTWSVIIITLPLLFTAASSPQISANAKMADFWVGHAKWVFEKVLLKTTGGEIINGDAGQIIVGPYDSTHRSHPWYHFNGGAGTKSSSCSYPSGWGIQVTRSWDKGNTWSAFKSVILPKANTPYACFATDGRVFYDAPLNKWRMLFQCDDGIHDWMGCYIEMNGSDPTVGDGTIDSPTSPWVSTAATGSSVKSVEVLISGELWSQICSSGKHCDVPNGMGEEGTFDIFQKDSEGYFWVDFHGAQAQPVLNMKMVRGIAKTKDFHHWIVNGQGTPTDSYFDTPTMLDPANNVNEPWLFVPANGLAAGGAGSIYVEDGLFYTIVEESNTETFSQATYWDLAIGRTIGPAPSATNWDFQTLSMGNPVFLSSAVANSASYSMPSDNLPPRTINYYPQIFQDPDTGTIYLNLDQVDNVTHGPSAYLYKLTLTNNRLINADFSTATWVNWNPLGGANLAVYRAPWAAYNNESTFLNMNCNGNCANGASIYQDVKNVSDLSGEKMTMSAALSSNVPCQAILAVFQWDKSGKISSSTSLVNLIGGGKWQKFSNAFTAVPNVVTMRYQIYMTNNTASYSLNEASLGATDGSHPAR